ncbi:hypothetical protein ACFY4B_30305 [Kitasatospora sp. NPDC001261]|uniref:hypothetical protein n=1 Tax=Kitasatospora sp. NPDC001261 TaxID=3364012 RepID=UPI0036875777
MRRHEGHFRELGLLSARHVTVDHQHDTAYLYFHTGSGITPAGCARLLSLTESGPPDTTVSDDMATFTAPDGPRCFPGAGDGSARPERGRESSLAESSRPSLAQRLT